MLLAKHLATHKFTTDLQHQVPELDMMFRRLKLIKCLWHVSCSNPSLQELDVDVLCGKLETCLKSATQNTMPQACERRGVCLRQQQPWFDI